MQKESLATIRARERKYFERGPEWFCELKFSDVRGLGYEDGVNRRDPSSVIKVGELFYTYYTKSVGAHVGFGTGDDTAKVWPWDQADIWYATSEDGIDWQEHGMVVGRGQSGEHDDQSVFTPEVLVHEGKYYLVYQSVKHPYRRRTKNTISMAIAEKPEGPFIKLAEPLLLPSDTGEWEGEDDNRFMVRKKGTFDSHKVHDPVLFYYNDKFYLYYKGEPMGEEMFMGGRETKWGVAIAEEITGPYHKSEYNPISNSGHETLLWQYDGGMVGLLSTDGVEKNTIQFAQDGINFEIMAVIKNAPEAAGPFRNPEQPHNLHGLDWGLCHVVEGEWNYIRRYEIDTTLRDWFMTKHCYE